jgi:hypothetical protein
MIEDGIPEILAEQRLGHQVPGMRGWYAHVSQQMRDELLVALQVRWEESLRKRAESTRTRPSRYWTVCSPRTVRAPARPPSTRSVCAEPSPLLR